VAARPRVAATNAPERTTGMATSDILFDRL
jgi:hypothetical protein